MGEWGVFIMANRAGLAAPGPHLLSMGGWGCSLPKMDQSRPLNHSRYQTCPEGPWESRGAGRERQRQKESHRRGRGGRGKSENTLFVGLQIQSRGEALVPARPGWAGPWGGQLPSLLGLSLQTLPGARLPGGWQELREGQWEKGAVWVLLQPPTSSSSEDGETGALRQEGRTGEDAATLGLGGRGGRLPRGLSEGAVPIWLSVASSSRSVSSRLSIRWGVAPLPVPPRPAPGWPSHCPLPGGASCPESLGVSSGWVSAVEGS